MTETPDNQVPQNEVADNQKLAMTGPFTDDGPEEDGVGKVIGMEANIMLKCVRVPDDGKLTEALKRQIRETVIAHRSKNRITIREIALQVNSSESTISEVLKGTYTRADDTPTLIKINNWLETDERRRSRSKPNGFHSTTIYEAILGLSVFAKSNARIPGAQKRAAVEQESSRIVIGWGPAGCGKSIGAAALNHADSTSILVRIEQRKGTDTGLSKLILAAGGWRGTPRNKNSIDFIIDKLRDTGRLLIVDEGHRLKFSGCELLRDLADVCGVPILILATSEFYDRMTSVRTRSGFLTYDQFSRRVGLVCELIRGLDGKGGSKRPIYDAAEIAAIFKSPKVRIAPDAIDYLQAVACTIGLGMLGEAGNIFDLALRSSLRGAKVIDEVLLRKCAKKALIPAGGVDYGVLSQIDQTLQTNRAMRPKAMQA